MVRTQISLTEEMHAWLRQRSRSDDVSMSEIVRRALARMRSEVDDRRVAALSVLGAFVADRDDVSDNHDEILARVYSGEDE